MAEPVLSIVIPVLNERDTLPALVASLDAQRGVAFEVVAVDGGSDDGSLEALEGLAAQANFPFRILRSERGRARQLNAGVAIARGEYLLFLHADSRFERAEALATGLAALKQECQLRGSRRVAGHFPLRFSRLGDSPSLSYYYYEAKACLDRPGCTHGDQGFLMGRSFFEDVGPFDSDLGLLEDTLLAETIRREGAWVLLPLEISTSARRFEAEGLFERQVLNALIMNSVFIGWTACLAELPGLYRSQGRTERLRLLPFLRKFREILKSLPLRQRLLIWYRTGGYVRPNAWQIAFFFDVRRNFRKGIPPGEGRTSVLDAFEPWFERLTDHPPGRAAAALLTRIWFCCAHLYALAVEGTMGRKAGAAKSTPRSVNVENKDEEGE
ncbi:MAG: glycosyl transferase [Desulfuromonas sp.]|uniref:TIGR04283 family arsenosugar biosynthesis glycosyltransferase n=1 Tax=Desulfuromonas sp. TaxID=892 RepID=UPI000CB92921|nr:TIGR04283 family arsenosugar biosynthesis glycosyltransferase [Desulfuromonas sp.]PLX85078.1 MAG: glycosyl transferase [Desulfuromonas sp.]